MAVLATGGMPDWWFGIFSTRTVVYRRGSLVRAGEDAGRRVDRDELALCRSLAARAEGIGVATISSDSECDFHRSFAVAVNEAVPKRINEALIRARFGGTILAVAPVLEQRLDEPSPWWSSMKRYIRNVGGSEERSRGLKDDAWMERFLEVARSLSERGLSWVDGLRAEEEANRDMFRRFLKLPSLNRLLPGPGFRDAAYVEIGGPSPPPLRNGRRSSHSGHPNFPTSPLASRTEAASPA